VQVVVQVAHALVRSPAPAALLPPGLPVFFWSLTPETTWGEWSDSWCDCCGPLSAAAWN